MTEQEFLKHYIQNAPHMMWFLGAGTSRSAGLPTANDIIWDLKLKHYCVRENQDIKAHDINNKAIKAKVQSYLDSRGGPALGAPEEYSYYFELVFGNDRAAQQKYIVQALATSKVSLTVGHRALGALLAGGHARIAFTTNFDEVIESGFARVSGRNLTAFHLEGPHAALDALNAEQFPIYAKIHGDFRYQSVKNLTADLLSNDAAIQKCFLAAAARYGLVVTGYSGRDANVMAMFREAIGQNNAFPHGLFWTTHRMASVAPVVKELIDLAISKGITAAIVEPGTFDEMMSKVWRQIPDKSKDFDSKYEALLRRLSLSRYPAPGTALPLIRTNALLITAPPMVCGTTPHSATCSVRNTPTRPIVSTAKRMPARTNSGER